MRGWSLSRCAQLRACLAQMSREHCEIINLVYHHEKPVEEVAKTIQMPENTVKTRMLYARNCSRFGASITSRRRRRLDRLSGVSISAPNAGDPLAARDPCALTHPCGGRPL
jgi:hypothetical protein